jgi:GMP synthase (glutamine-hydrolysing)
MEYMSTSTQDFDAENFIALQTEEIKRVLGKERAIIAVSGGVDSTTCASLTRRAIGKNLECLFIDTGFMRRGEPERVKKNLAKAPLGLPLRIISARKRFMDSLQGLADAEDKRKAFRDTFYSTLAEAARKGGCKWLAQGTIAADLVETEGGIKTQHNVLSQIGIDPKEKIRFQGS